MVKKRERQIILLLIFSAILTLILSVLLFNGIRENISKSYIEFIIGLSTTIAGFGLVAFQIGRTANELKKDFIESSILMVLASLLGIAYWVYPSTALAMISSILFLWGLVLLVLILINERFRFIPN
jgi:hypothetical protein